MGGGGRHMGIGHGGRMKPRRHQSGDVGHIHPEVRPHLVGNLTEALEVDHPGIGGRPRDDHAGLALLGDTLHLVVVNDAALLVHAVGHHVEILAGVVYRASVGQMPAVVQVHAQHSVPGLAQGHIDGVIGLGAGVGLDVGKFRPEQLAGPLNGQVFRHIHAMTAAVIPLAGVSLGVLVGEHTTHSSQHRLGHDVLRRDQLDVLTLALVLRPDGRAHLGVMPGYKIHIF